MFLKKFEPDAKTQSARLCHSLHRSPCLRRAHIDSVVLKTVQRSARYFDFELSIFSSLSSIISLCRFSSIMYLLLLSYFAALQIQLNASIANEAQNDRSARNGNNYLQEESN
jgi:hypothetical protein